MPKWNQPPQQAMRNALHEAYEAVNRGVKENQTFDEVAQVSLEDLAEQASQAVTSYLSSSDSPAETSTQLFQVYCMGFLVGARYGAHLSDTSHEREEHGTQEQGGQAQPGDEEDTA